MMIFPTLYNAKWVTNTGELTPELQVYNDQLIQSLQDGLSDNGWTVASLKTADIITIALDMPPGTIWYCSDHVPPCWVGWNGTNLVQFSTTAFP